MSAAREWLIWSNEHLAFWAANHRGYTSQIDRAGRYTKAQADKICSKDGPSHRAGVPDEVALLAPGPSDPCEGRCPACPHCHARGAFGLIAPDDPALETDPSDPYFKQRPTGRKV